MLEQFSQLLPAEGLKILLVLFLSFLIGLEREEHKAETEHYSFGGVRTFPLIGLVGYVIALLSAGQIFSDRKTGFRSLGLLSALALMGLIPIWLLKRFSFRHFSSYVSRQLSRSKKCVRLNHPFAEA